MAEELVSFSVDGIQMGFSQRTGMIRHLGSEGGESVAGHDQEGLSLDARLGRGAWLSDGETAQLVSHEIDGSCVALTVNLGPITLRDVYRVRKARIQRRVEVENTSSEEVQLNGVRMFLPGVQIGDPLTCLFNAPASAVRPRIRLELAARQEIDGPFETIFAPGAPGRFGRAIEDAPDVTPGLLAVHNTTQGASTLIWYFSDVEAGTPRIFGDGKLLTLGHEIGLAGWLAPGSRLSAGTQFIQLHRGSWQEALDVFRKHYSDVGIDPPLYGAPSEWVRTASIYEVHPGPFGGFRGLMSDLPRIREMGHDVLYLMPVMLFDNRSGIAWDENWLGSGSPYAMKDFEVFEPTLGSEQDFKALVGEAHDLGMKVLMDFVAQGCALGARYIEEHPEWMARDEDGELVSSHGWDDTYSFDWANTEFQEYMLGWALRFVREYGIDGYRVDAPHGKEPNWDRHIPYHASKTNLGVLRLLDELSQGVKAIDGEAALLCELFGPVFVRNHDFQYDYYPFAQLYALLRGDLTPFEFGLWLQDYWAVMPPGAVRVCFTETHDTRRDFTAYAWRGSAAERAMYAILILAGFVPMMWAGQERGWEAFYRRVLKARSHSEALKLGVRIFNAVICDHAEVLSIVCHRGEEWIWGVVSLHAERTPLTFDLTASLLHAPEGSFRLLDLISEEEWCEVERSEWRPGELQSLTLSLVPYVPYFFRIVEL